MIIYNVTVKVSHEINQGWLEWMKTKHIPDVLNTGLFEKHHLCRLIEEDQKDGITYAIQYFCKDMSAYFDYQHNHAPALQEEHTERYKDQFVAFRTLLRVID